MQPATASTYPNLKTWTGSVMRHTYHELARTQILQKFWLPRLIYMYINRPFCASIYIYIYIYIYICVCVCVCVWSEIVIFTLNIPPPVFILSHPKPSSGKYNTPYFSKLLRERGGLRFLLKWHLCTRHKTHFIESQVKLTLLVTVGSFLCNCIKWPSKVFVCKSLSLTDVAFVQSRRTGELLKFSALGRLSTSDTIIWNISRNIWVNRKRARKRELRNWTIKINLLLILEVTIIFFRFIFSKRQYYYWV